MAGDAEQEVIRATLRRHAMRFAALITEHPKAWGSEASWLRDLPRCWTIEQTEDPNHPALKDGRFVGELEDTPWGVRVFLYDDEEARSRRLGPICRKLMDGWLAAIYRFKERFNDRYYDFGMRDAKRIALLTALLWNRDFDGVEVGLGWRWTQSEAEDVVLNCREWAWSRITSEYLAEQALLSHIEVAAEYIDANRRRIVDTPNPSQVPPPKTRQRGATKTGDPKFPDKTWVLLQVAALEHGIPAGTLHRWVKKLPAGDKGETEPRRRVVIRRSALKKLIDKHERDDPAG